MKRFPLKHHDWALVRREQREDGIYGIYQCVSRDCDIHEKEINETNEDEFFKSIVLFVCAGIIILFAIAL